MDSASTRPARSSPRPPAAAARDVDVRAEMSTADTPAKRADGRMHPSLPVSGSPPESPPCSGVDGPCDAARARSARPSLSSRMNW